MCPLKVLLGAVLQVFASDGTHSDAQVALALFAAMRRYVHPLIARQDRGPPPATSGSVMPVTCRFCQAGRGGSWELERFK